jgi:hypothetical protein
MEVFLSDNNGHRVPPADAPDPIAASGQTLTNGTALANGTATVVEGATYAFTSMILGGFIFGVAATTTAANIIWACPIYKTIVITIPNGVTSLHWATNVNSGVGYLRRIN